MWVESFRISAGEIYGTMRNATV